MNSNLEQETKSHQIESLTMSNGSDDHEGINSTPSLLEPSGKNKQCQYIITYNISYILSHALDMRYLYLCLPISLSIYLSKILSCPPREALSVLSLILTVIQMNTIT